MHTTVIKRCASRVYVYQEIRMALKLLRDRMSDDVFDASVPCWHLVCFVQMQNRTRESPAGRQLLPDSGVARVSLAKGLTMPTMDPIQIKPRDAGRPIVLPLCSSERAWKIKRWPWVVPQEHQRINLKTKEQGRHHLDELLAQKAVRDAVAKVGLTKRATCHTVRHAVAMHVLESDYDIRTGQELLGHRDVKTTMSYRHVLHRGPAGVRSPVDGMWTHVRRWC